MKTREQYGHGDAGAAVQLAGEGVPRAHGRESDDVRHEGAGRPEPDAPDRRRTLAVAENGGPGSGVRGGLRAGLGRPSDSAPRPPAPEAFVTGEENEEEQSDDRRATYGRTGVRKRRGGPMRTLALRRCARVLRSKPRHGHVLRLRGRVGQRRTGSTDRDGSDPPVRGPGTGSEAGVFAHPCPRPLGVAPGQLSLRGKAVQRRFEAAEHPFAGPLSVGLSDIAEQGRPRWAGPQPTPPSLGCARPGHPKGLPAWDTWTGAAPCGGWDGACRRAHAPSRCRTGHPKRGVAPVTAASSGAASPLRRPWCNRKAASDIRNRWRAHRNGGSVHMHLDVDVHARYTTDPR